MLIHRKALVTTLCALAFGVSSCGKKDTTTPPATAPGDGGSSEDNGEDDGSGGSGGTTGSLSLGTLGVSVLPVSSSGAHLTAITERNEGMSTGSLQIETALRGTTASGLGLMTTAPTPNPFNISSAAPTEFKFYIKKISLRADEGAPVTLVESEEGIPVHITESGTVDLSALTSAFEETSKTMEAETTTTSNTSAMRGARLAEDDTTTTSSDDSTDETADVLVTPGEYTSVEVTYAVGAYIRGCVTADWDDGTASDVSLRPEAGEVTYCTVEGKDTFAIAADGPFSASDFKFVGTGDPEPELALFNLAKSHNDEADEVEDSLLVTYTPIDPITITAGESTPLTLLIDLNRMLRFVRGAHGESPPNPSMEDGAYFFTTVFEDSTSVFVGSPGRILGFELITQACPESDLSGSTCNSYGGFENIGGWMTLILDSSQRPLYGIVMPDNDNDLTVVKGTSRQFASETTGLPNFIVESESDATELDILYGLDEVEGRLVGFDPDFINTEVGGSVSGITFEFVHSSDGVETPYAGPVWVTRRL